MVGHTHLFHNAWSNTIDKEYYVLCIYTTVHVSTRTSKYIIRYADLRASWKLSNHLVICKNSRQKRALANCRRSVIFFCTVRPTLGLFSVINQTSLRGPMQHRCWSWFSFMA